MSKSTVKAVMTSLGLIILYTALSYAVFGALVLSTMSMFGGPEYSPASGLMPFQTSSAIGGSFPIFGFDVPSWVWSILANLLIVKAFLLGGQAAMSRVGAGEIKMLRIGGLLFTGLMSWGLIRLLVPAVTTVTSSPGFGGPSYGGATAVEIQQYVSAAFFVALVPVFCSISYLSSWNMRAEEKHYPDGLFSMRRMLSGHPSGGLPYLVCCWIAAVAGVEFGIFQAGALSTFEIWIRFGYVLGVLVFLYSLGRLSSALTKADISSARKLHFGAIMMVTLLPLPVILIMDASSSYSSGQSSFAWNIYLFSSPFMEDIIVALGQATVLTVLGAAIIYISERIRSRKTLDSTSPIGEQA
jgi:hypothetical protein